MADIQDRGRIVDLVNDSIASYTNSPAATSGEFSATRWTRIFCKVRNGRFHPAVLFMSQGSERALNSGKNKDRIVHLRSVRFRLRLDERELPARLNSWPRRRRGWRQARPSPLRASRIPSR